MDCAPRSRLRSPAPLHPVAPRLIIYCLRPTSRVTPHPWLRVATRRDATFSDPGLAIADHLCDRVALPSPGPQERLVRDARLRSLPPPRAVRPQAVLYGASWRRVQRWSRRREAAPTEGGALLAQASREEGVARAYESGRGFCGRCGVAVDNLGTYFRYCGDVSAIDTLICRAGDGREADGRRHRTRSRRDLPRCVQTTWLLVISGLYSALLREFDASLQTFVGWTAQIKQGLRPLRPAV